MAIIREQTMTLRIAQKGSGPDLGELWSDLNNLADTIRFSDWEVSDITDDFTSDDDKVYEVWTLRRVSE